LPASNGARLSLTRVPPIGSGRQKIWRRTEVLIPTPEGAIPLRTGAGRSPGSFSNHRNLGTILIGASRPIAFRATPRPTRLAFRGGGVRYRAPHVAVLTVFKTGPASSPVTPPHWPSRGDSNTRPRGSEPRALVRLSYVTFVSSEKWSGQEDSNLRSRASEARALAGMDSSVGADP
jgi:hypothetical protein